MHHIPTKVEAGRRAPGAPFGSLRLVKKRRLHMDSRSSFTLMIEW